jgi:hypothetical protein
MAKATGQDVKALLLKARKVPNEPGSVHDVKPSDFLSKSVRSIWKYPDGLVFRCSRCCKASTSVCSLTKS